MTSVLRALLEAGQRLVEDAELAMLSEPAASRGAPPQPLPASGRRLKPGTELTDHLPAYC